jgi:hypothetical protein
MVGSFAPMNARRLLPLILSATALAAYAQEVPSPSAPGATPAAPAENIPTPAPAASELGAKPASAAPSAPAPRLPVPGPKADPALDLMPAQPGQLLPPATEATPLIPEAPESTAKPGAGKDKKEKQSKTEIAEQEQLALIHLRDAKTLALVSDPTFGTEFHEANARHTDLEKRQALKKYYQRLYARIRKIDPSTKKLADERERLATGRLDQRRLATTEALDDPARSAAIIRYESAFSTDF